MVPRIYGLLLLSCLCAVTTAVVAESELMTLTINPFSRPQSLTAPPPPVEVEPEVILPPEKVKLDLTATLVSVTSPMVVVDGKLLKIGEEIKGLKLISVMEGKAIFARSGEKFSFMVVDEQPQ